MKYCLCGEELISTKGKPLKIEEKKRREGTSNHYYNERTNLLWNKIQEHDNNK